MCTHQNMTHQHTGLLKSFVLTGRVIWDSRGQVKLWEEEEGEDEEEKEGEDEEEGEAWEACATRVGDGPLLLS